MPYIFLGIRQFVGKTFDDFLCCPHWFHGKCIRCFLCLFFEKLHCQYKKKKLVKHEPFSGSKQFLHIPRKMYGTYCKIIVRQLIALPDLLWQIFCF